MYATANLYDRYKQDYVTTAGPMDLIVMLYDGCIKQIKLAKIHHESEELSQFLSALERGEEIILELIRSLNFDIELSNNLLQLYEFLLNEMVEVSLSKEIARLDPCIDMLADLREAWAAAKTSVDKKNNYSYDENE